MARVFVSYSRKDAEFVLQLAADLKQQNVPVWLDQFDIPLGERWDAAIETALTTSSHVLVVLSPAAVESQNVLDEIGYAVDENKTIIPVELEECEIPFRIRRVQRLSFHDDYAAALERLLQNLPRGSASDAKQNAPKIKTMAYDFNAPLVINRQSRLNTEDVPVHNAPVLVFEYGMQGAHVPILHTPLIIGRGSDCDVVVRNEQVSRRHVRISLEKNTYYVEDLESRNGTALNRQQLVPGNKRALMRGDELNLAAVRVFFDPTLSPDFITRRRNDTDDMATVLFNSMVNSVWRSASPGTPIDHTLQMTVLLDRKSVEIMASTGAVSVKGVVLDPPLTDAQLALLQLLYKANGAACSQQQIAQMVWPDADPEEITERAIANLVQNLRDRIAEIDPEWRYVVSEGKQGYRFNNRPLKK